MLKKILIKNIALIPEVEINLGEGLNVLSGETGAGKSIIVDSLNFVLGIKTDKSIVRHGEKQAYVEAVFDSTSACDGIMDEIGIEKDDIIIITRTITAEGRTDIKVNGRSVALSMLKKLTALLVDIHGQHEHQAILKSSNHLDILDSFNNAIKKIKDNILIIYEKYKNKQREIHKFGGSDAERMRAADLLKYQIDEITQAKLNAAEESDLKAKRLRFINLSKITNAVKLSLGYINDNQAYSIPEALSLSGNALNSISEYEKEIPDLINRLKSARIELLDITDALEKLFASLDYSETDADETESRINVYKTICKKYGGSIENVSAYLANAKDEFDKLTNSAEIIAKLQSEITALENELYSKCMYLTEQRRITAKNLEKRIKDELTELAMASQIEIKFNEYTRDTFLKELSANGADTVEFFFSANKGEPLKPLAKIISGGEMSRFMLAIKNITADTDSLPTMVFDEIDTGISGKIGQVVAIKLAAIASEHQVICVTHLAQIAAMADYHYLISKHEIKDKTYTQICYLDEEGEYEEIARLSGGKDISALSIEHAKELKKWSYSIKNKKPVN